MKVSQKEASLITSLATALHECVLTHNEKSMWTIYSIPHAFRFYTEVCATLYKLDLASITDGTDHFPKYTETPEMVQLCQKISMTGIYKAELVEASNIRQTIDFSHMGTSITLNTLIEQFAVCMSKLGLNGKIPVSRKLSFRPDNLTLVSAMDALASDDYALKKGLEYQWTDKVSTHMISAYLWTQDEVISAKIPHDSIDTSYQKLIKNLDKIPLYSRGNISTSTTLGLSIALLEYWDGAVWYPQKLYAPEIPFEEAMSVSEKFLSAYAPFYHKKDKWAPKQHKALSKEDKKLVSALVKPLHKIWTLLPGEDVKGYSHHGFTNAFKSALKILWILNLGKAAWPKSNFFDVTYEKYISYYANPQNLIFAPYFKPIPKAEIDNKIDFENFYPTLSVLEILKTFIELSSDYGGTLPTNRNTEFEASDEDQREALNVLAEFDYVQSTPNSYCWTDRIAPAMICSYSWTEDDFDEATVNASIVEKEFNQMREVGLSKIPSWFPDGYMSQSSNHVMGLTFGILQHWSGSGWSEEPVQAPLVSFDNACALAGEILVATPKPQ